MRKDIRKLFTMTAESVSELAELAKEYRQSMSGVIRLLVHREFVKLGLTLRPTTQEDKDE